jgi:5-methyltetrahydrofolate--homocysteine methyltransferase
MKSSRFPPSKEIHAMSEQSELNGLLERIAAYVERGKVNARSPFPPDLKGQDGVDELTRQAMAAGCSPQDLLEQGLIKGMDAIGARFRRDEVYVPDVLMAAKAMKTGMAHIRPFFQSGAVKRKGVFIIGTVAGDMHDIGKNLVAMVVEGGGFEVIDLGIDVPTQAFLDAVAQQPAAVVGLSALLTTTMTSMAETVQVLKQQYPATRVMVGGAPVTAHFAGQIGADAYTPDPQGAVEYLNAIVA